MALVLIKIVFTFLAIIVGYVVGWLITFLVPPALCGVLTWWLFDDFGIGFLVGIALSIVVGVVKFIRSRSSSSSSTSVSSSSSSRYTSSVSLPYSSSSSSCDDDDRDDDSDKQERIAKRRKNKYEQLMTEADKAYREYEYYKSKAEAAESKAEDYESYAEDCEYRYKEGYGDEYYGLACDGRSSARYYYNEANQYHSDAERFHREYEELIHQADWVLQFG